MYQLYSRIGVPMEPVRRLSVLLLLWSVAKGYAGVVDLAFGNGVSKSAVPFFSDAPWRIKEELDASGLAWVL